MDNAIYAALTRQAGLARELEVVANNMANVSTTGYRRQGAIFSEYVSALGGDADSLSMARAHGRMIDPTPGGLSLTGGALDIAILGEGYFQVAAAQDGVELTRAGAFAVSPDNQLTTLDGRAVLDAGGAAIDVPAGQVAVGRDGALSTEAGPFAQLGIVRPAEGASLALRAGARLAVTGGVEPVEDPQVVQGSVEGSNVDPVREIARLIEVQRAYEIGQSFLDREDERIRNVITTLSQ